MDHIGGKSEHIIQNVVGCGCFQVILMTVVHVLLNASSCYSLLFMSFGNYNPGWRCLDSNGTTSNDSLTNTSSGPYIKDDCPLFDSCTNIEFDPGTSTIVSEWGLLCDDAWIPSAIISIQMAGLALGCSVSGFVGDAIGRRSSIYIGQAILVVANLLSIFSSSWQMFAALKFCIGLGIAFKVTFYYIYSAEFVTRSWRAIISSLPFWPVASIIFAVTCMTSKQWRELHIVSTVVSFIAFATIIWAPESLRWLEVKNKKVRFDKLVNKIAKLNRKTLPPLESIDMFVTNEKETGQDKKVYNVLDLFRPGYKLYTVLIAIPWLSMSVIYYAIAFGVKDFSGDLYMNIIIMYATEIPLTIFPMFAPNVLGRKLSSFLFVGISGISLLIAALFDRFASGETRSKGVVVLANVGRIAIGGFWGIMQVYTAEIYPTVVRGLGTSWGNVMARIGGIAAPFLIPNDPDTFFLCYLIMGSLGLVCCGVVLVFTETKEKPLPATFEVDEKNCKMHPEAQSENELLAI